MTAAARTFTCEQIARAALGEPTKRAGAELQWHCPRHEDRHESLSINPLKDVFLCAPCNVSGTAWSLAAFLAGVDAADKPGVTAWLRERGLLNGKRPATTRGAKWSGKRRQVVATYEYRDENGNLVARKLRIEPGPDGKKKTFAWQRWGDGAWVDGLGSSSGSVEPPLYRLREIKSEAFAVLTEGEKDADAGAAFGLPTTTSGGTGSFRNDHAETLRGKRVAIVAHADDPGRKHAQKVAARLYGKALSLKVVELPGAKDLAEAVEKPILAAPEWLDSGHLKRFQWTGILADGKKAHTNKVPCHTDLEKKFADFLDNAKDILRYSKNERFGFSVTYYEHNRPRQFYPDFIVAVREKDGKETMWLAETKGEMRTNVPLKNGAAEQWCEKMSTTRYGQWRYLFAQQVKLERALNKGAATFAELASDLAG